MGLFKKSAKSKFEKNYEIAHSRQHPMTRLAAANEALANMQEIKSWPYGERLLRKRAEGKLHAVIGLVHMLLAEARPAEHSEDAWRACEHALDYLTSADGNAYALALMNAGIANADRRSGDNGANVERAIEFTSKALEAMANGAADRDLARCHGNLSSFYSERQIGNRVENLELAIFHGHRLVEYTRKFRDGGFLAGALAELGKHYQQRLEGEPKENYHQSVSLLEEAVKVGGAALEPPYRAMILMDLLTAMTKHGGESPDKLATGVHALETEALGLINPRQHPEQWGVLHMRLAGLRLDQQTGDVTKNRADALAYINEALAVLDEQNYPEHRKHALYLQMGARATTHESAGHKDDIEIAVKNARAALAQEDKSLSHRNWARAAMTLAELLSSGRTLDRARGIEEAISVSQKVRVSVSLDEDPQLWFQATEALGNCYAMRPTGKLHENIEHSIAYLEEAFSKTDTTSRPERWVSLALNLANSYEDRLTGSEADNLERAIALYESALVVATSTRHPRLRQSVLKGLSRCWSRRVRGEPADNLKESLVALESAKRLAEETNDKAAAMLLQNDIWNAHSRINNLSKEKDKTAVEGDQENNATSHEFLENLEQTSNNINKATNLLGWIESRVTLGDFLTKASPANTDGLEEMMSAMVKQCARAIDVYTEALSHVDKSGFPMLWARVRGRIATANGLRGLFSDWRYAGFHEQRDGDEKLAQAGHEISRQSLVEERGALQDVLEIYNREAMPRRHLQEAVRLGKVEARLGNWDEAHSVFQSASTAANALLADVEVNVLEQEKIIAQLSVLASLAPLAAIKSGQTDKALAVAESSRARLLSKSLTLDALPFTQSEVETLTSLREKIMAQEARLTSPALFNRSAPVRELMTLRDEMRALVMSKGFSGELAQGKVQSLIEAAVAEGTVLVFPFLTEFGGQVAIAYSDRGAISIRTIEADPGGELKQLFRRGSGKDDDSWVTAYLAYTEPHGSRFKEQKWEYTLDDFSVALGKSFSQPLAQLLSDLNIRPGTTLRVFPHGFLGHLPIGISRLDDENVLLERFPVSQVPSLSVMSLSVTPSVDVPSIITIAPSFTGKIADLPNARMEARIARSLYNVSNDLGDDGWGNKEELFERLDGHSVWHFGTHASFNTSEPLKSELSLSDRSSLTAGDIIGARLKRPPDLVILSACQSGLYGLDKLPTEFVGLPSAFIQAGAKGVIATLWPVRDLPSAILLSKFHQEYAPGKTPVPLCLQTAQVWLRDSSAAQLISHLEALPAGAGGDDTTLAQAISTFKNQSPESYPYRGKSNWAGFFHFGR